VIIVYTTTDIANIDLTIKNLTGGERSNLLLKDPTMRGYGLVLPVDLNRKTAIPLLGDMTAPVPMTVFTFNCPTHELIYQGFITGTVHN
jgi:hypothetical protein